MPARAVEGRSCLKNGADGELVSNPHIGAMTAHKPSRADEAHIVAAEYRRKQSAGIERIAHLMMLRLAQEEKAETPKPKRKARAIRHSKTRGFGRWSAR